MEISLTKAMTMIAVSLGIVWGSTFYSLHMTAKSVQMMRVEIRR